jgi:hypothetical protein
MRSDIVGQMKGTTGSILYAEAAHRNKQLFSLIGNLEPPTGRLGDEQHSHPLPVNRPYWLLYLGKIQNRKWLRGSLRGSYRRVAK